jgi:hypothetical protein
MFLIGWDGGFETSMNERHVHAGIDSPSPLPDTQATQQYW